jgi:hypothetical protein
MLSIIATILMLPMNPPAENIGDARTRGEKEAQQAYYRFDIVVRAFKMLRNYSTTLRRNKLLGATLLTLLASSFKREDCRTSTFCS